ncbi:hypothetical protein NE626_15650, partial [Intestinimonas massiliensis]|nr:hypothetical protein [Intestinimonas massiliensis (ex Afouda et al. 2020)]
TGHPALRPGGGRRLVRAAVPLPAAADRRPGRRPPAAGRRPGGAGPRPAGPLSLHRQPGALPPSAAGRPPGLSGAVRRLPLPPRPHGPGRAVPGTGARDLRRAGG